MKMTDIKSMKDEKIAEELLSLSKEQMNLRFQKAGGTLENPNRWREVRTTKARLKTEQTARSNQATAQS